MQHWLQQAKRAGAQIEVNAVTCFVETAKSKIIPSDIAHTRSFSLLPSEQVKFTEIIEQWAVPELVETLFEWQLSQQPLDIANNPYLRVLLSVEIPAEHAGLRQLQQQLFANAHAAIVVALGACLPDNYQQCRKILSDYTQFLPAAEQESFVSALPDTGATANALYALMARAAIPDVLYSEEKSFAVLDVSFSEACQQCGSEAILGLLLTWRIQQGAFVIQDDPVLRYLLGIKIPAESLLYAQQQYLFEQVHKAVLLDLAAIKVQSPSHHRKKKTKKHKKAKHTKQSTDIQQSEGDGLQEIVVKRKKPKKAFVVDEAFKQQFDIYYDSLPAAQKKQLVLQLMPVAHTLTIGENRTWLLANFCGVMQEQHMGTEEQLHIAGALRESDQTLERELGWSRIKGYLPEEVTSVLEGQGHISSKQKQIESALIATLNAFAKRIEEAKGRKDEVLGQVRRELITLFPTVSAEGDVSSESKAFQKLLSTHDTIVSTFSSVSTENAASILRETYVENEVPVLVRLYCRVRQEYVDDPRQNIEQMSRASWLGQFKSKGLHGGDTGQDVESGVRALPAENSDKGRTHYTPGDFK